MAEPGWYPDPAGTPGQRYFDGREWSTTVRRAPSVGDDAGAYATRKRRMPRPLRMLLTIVGGLLALGIVGAASAWAVTRPTPERPSPSYFTPTAPPSSGRKVDPCRGVHDHNPTATPRDTTRLSAGKLSLPRLAGFDGFPSFRYVSDYAGLSQEVAGARWISWYAVGTLLKDRFGNDVASAARAVDTCLGSSIYYDVPTTQVHAKRDPVAGRPAAQVRSERRPKDAKGVTGDRCDVVVVDTGLPDRFAVVMIGMHLDPTRLAYGDQLLAGLQVES